MIFWIVLTVVAIVLLIGLVISVSDGYAEALGGAFVFSFIVIVVVSLIGLTPLGSRSQHVDNAYDLQAINSNTRTEGQFFLGSGGFGQKAVFYAYTKDEAGQFRLIQVPASDAVVVETSETPRVVYSCSYSIGKPGYFGPLSDFASDSGQCNNDVYDHVTFYVPPGSITNTIKLDLPGS